MTFKSLESKDLLPNLVIVGAMKCGTSSLHQYLSLHPQIWMSKKKELDFFVAEKNWKKGLNWYQEQFLDSANNEILVRGESSPNYTKYPAFKGVAQRMHSIIPDAKIIYIVRDPIQRIISHYTHNFACRDENRNLEDALKSLENNHYINCSCYYTQLKQFLDYYPLKQIMIVSLEELFHHRLSTLQKVFKFLEVSPNFSHEAFLEITHSSKPKKRLTRLGRSLASVRGGRRLWKVFPQLMMKPIQAPEIPYELSIHLQATFRNDMQDFFTLTDCDFSQWKIFHTDQKP